MVFSAAFVAVSDTLNGDKLLNRKVDTILFREFFGKHLDFPKVMELRLPLYPFSETDGI